MSKNRKTSRRRLWREKAFEKLGTRSLVEIPKPYRSDTLRKILGAKSKHKNS